MMRQPPVDLMSIGMAVIALTLAFFVGKALLFPDKEVIENWDYHACSALNKRLRSEDWTLTNLDGPSRIPGRWEAVSEDGAQQVSYTCVEENGGRYAVENLCFTTSDNVACAARPREE